MRFNVEQVDSDQRPARKLVSPFSKASPLNRTDITSYLPIRDTPANESSHPGNGCRSERTRTLWTDLVESSVPGLDILRGAIEPAHRDMLVMRIHADGRWEPDFSRLRQSYGYKYGYKNDVLFRQGDAALPPWILELVKFVCDHKWMNRLAQQVTIQKYAGGSLIGSHVDSRRCFPGEIVTISLVSAATFRMTHKRNRTRFTTELDPGDVVVLRGDARNVWKHEILKCSSAANEDAASWYRLSITLRNINPERVRP